METNDFISNDRNPHNSKQSEKYAKPKLKICKSL